MARFVAIPEVGEDLPDWATIMFSSLKEDMELLIGARGEVDFISRAIVRGDITVDLLGDQVMGTVTRVSPDGYSISGSSVAGLDAFRALRDDVQVLANDLYTTRLALDTLLRNLGVS